MADHIKILHSDIDTGSSIHLVTRTKYMVQYLCHCGEYVATWVSLAKIHRSLSRTLVSGRPTPKRHYRDKYRAPHYL